ncbi:MAG: NADH-quinone oxidoreductase subunit NuoF [Desulfobacterales bacterium]|uniref:NADH-quinone oxidoreductase subunit NuoF n=1 Tax=Candidatus Desulfaltia bathyphila TaxID=2841697 RepID=A0A8J6N6B5_9BACT|nr:NADH-quinone oxidoreductase subunit NuoF [Candidatus Desulfaltia bathyphila]MBL7195059.1 NADH-quinone oxidoreductase subunit NuoF [Desulfobacterales bacterium]MBL7207120.1 NADH-quinone oxidoreductase subunit NuoF [Desulfobacterales bacterium]
MRTISDLEDIRESILQDKDSEKTIIRLCLSTGCRAQKSLKVNEALENEIKKYGLQNKIEIKKTGCHGFCEMGPIMVIEPANIFYCNVKPKYAGDIISETVLNGNVINRLLWKDPLTKELTKTEKDFPVYRKQRKNVFYNSGKIDPTDIDDYIAAGGYSALGKALATMTPPEIVKTVVDSGLRGRGGGGFPTGIKWRICSAAPGDIKYIIANGDEGDPGAFMDRSLMEGDPHAIIEGMIIAAFAIGANQGFIYIRKEYPIAIDHLSIAIKQAEECGLLGNDILGTGFNFTIKIDRGAGAFVCGEETALMISIEGRSGIPRSRPPYPAFEGLWGKPTVINNVETFANIPKIILKGADWYSSIGTSTSKGTKIFSLVGKVRNTGLIEVEMGTTLREIIFDIGGGVRKGKRFKAVQTGGPSGGCIPISRIDMPIDYDSLKDAGAIMGSGGMIVMDETSCMVDVARYFINFLLFESCGKCIPCREGLKQMHHILTNICEGLGEKGDIERLEELAHFMMATSLCGLGGTAPNPVLSTIRYFRDEYDAHIYDKKCSAGVCKNLFEYVIDAELCNGCTICKLKCPEKAISGEKKKPHSINPLLCIKCGICFNLCKREAIRVK